MQVTGLRVAEDEEDGNKDQDEVELLLGFVVVGSRLRLNIWA